MHFRSGADLTMRMADAPVLQANQDSPFPQGVPFWHRGAIYIDGPKPEGHVFIKGPLLKACNALKLSTDQLLVLEHLDGTIKPCHVCLLLVQPTTANYSFSSTPCSSNHFASPFSR